MKNPAARYRGKEEGMNILKIRIIHITIANLCDFDAYVIACRQETGSGDGRGELQCFAE